MRWLKVYEKSFDVPVSEQDIHDAVGDLPHEIGPSRDGYIEVGIDADFQKFKKVAKKFNDLGYETNFD